MNILTSSVRTARLFARIDKAMRDAADSAGRLSARVVAEKPSPGLGEAAIDTTLALLATSNEVRRISVAMIRGLREALGDGAVPDGLLRPVAEVYRSRLRPDGPSDVEVDGVALVRRECPFCPDGLLLGERNEATGKLKRTDACRGCGHAVLYMDDDGGQVFDAASDAADGA